MQGYDEPGYGKEAGEVDNPIVINARLCCPDHHIPLDDGYCNACYVEGSDD